MLDFLIINRPFENYKGSTPWLHVNKPLLILLQVWNSN